MAMPIFGTYDAYGNLICHPGATTTASTDAALSSEYWCHTVGGESTPKPEKPKKKAKPVAKVGDAWYRRFDRKSRRK